MMTAPHLRFRHLDAAVTTATAALLEARTSELPPADAKAEFQQWADTATAAYHLPPLTIHTDTADRDWAPAPHGYTPDATISLRGRTITALLKNFRRHMQHHGARPLGTPDDDAAAWALSLYYTVRPRQLARLTAGGRIPGLSTTDLTEPGPTGHIAHATPATPAYAYDEDRDGDDPDSGDSALPIDGNLRRAIFAALRDHYGTDLPRAVRLEQLTLLTGRPIYSINQLTCGEAGRILATLRTTTGPADRRLHAGRAYIRHAARNGSITTRDRDRYLAILDTESRRAPSTAAALTAIRARAIELYETEEICHPSLTGFLTATNLAPHPQH